MSFGNFYPKIVLLMEKSESGSDSEGTIGKTDSQAGISEQGRSHEFLSWRSTHTTFLATTQARLIEFRFYVPLDTKYVGDVPKPICWLVWKNKELTSS